VKGVEPGGVFPWSADLSFILDTPVGALNLPVRKSGEIPVPTVPKIKLNDISWGSISLDSASAVLDIGIENTNSFPIDLASFDYGFEIAGVRLAGARVEKGARFDEGGSGSLRIPISFSPKSLGLAGMKLITGGKFDYRLAGSMAAGTPFGDLEFPFDKKGRGER